MDQVILEIVDIWHFGLSLMIQTSEEIASLPDIIESQLKVEVVKPDFRDALEDFTAKTLNTRKFCLPEFAALMASVDLSFDELYTRYLGKNVLNFFRQDHGYQDGSYKKVWSGKEDNEHLVDVMQETDLSDENAQKLIYEALKSRYHAN